MAPRKRKSTGSYEGYLRPGAEFRMPRSSYYALRKESTIPNASKRTCHVNCELPNDNNKTDASDSSAQNLCVEINSGSPTKDNNATENSVALDNQHPLHDDINLEVLHHIDTRRDHENTPSGSNASQNLLQTSFPIDSNNATENLDVVITVEDNDRVTNFETQPESEFRDGLSDTGNEDFLTVYNQVQDITELYKNQYKHLGQKCRDDLEIKLIEVLLLVQNYLNRHNGDDVMAESLLKMLSFILEIGNDELPVTRNLYKKIFCSDIQMLYHFFCPKCHHVLKSVETILNKRKKELLDCPLCEKKDVIVNNLSNTNYFITLSVEQQIQKMLQDPSSDLSRSLKNKSYMKNSAANGKEFEDIFDGEKYQELIKKLNTDEILTYIFNTDGATAFDGKNNKSIWPIQIIINEIDKGNRFSYRNMILAGLWFNRDEPTMEIFFNYFVKEARRMENIGITWTDGEKNVNCRKVIPLAGCLDSVARHKLQKVSPFNGYYGCGYCKHPGTLVTLREAQEINGKKIKAVRQVRYCLLAETPSLRNHEEMRQQMLDFHSTGQSAEGIEGVCPLMILKYFDVSNGFPVDYFHCELLGVTPGITEMYFDSKFHGEEFYIGNKVTEIDEKILQIRPPVGLCRLPQKVSERGNWKGTEWRNWLLFYSLPILIEFLPEKYFKHYALLVTATYILLSDKISEERLKEATLYLEKFVCLYEKYFGRKFMVYNIHLLLHLPLMVKLYGPLWTVSTFIFESCNGILLKMAHGTISYANQIVTRYVRDRTINTNILSSYEISEKVISFCDSITFFPSVKSFKIEPTIRILKYGSYKHTFTAEEMYIISKEISGNIPKEVTAYSTFIKHRIKYHSEAYSRSIRTNDTIVYLESKEYGIIQGIFDIEGKILAYVRLIKILNNCIFLLEKFEAKAPHLSPCMKTNDFKAVPLKSIKKKCISIEFDDKLYLSNFCNLVELRD